MTTRVGPKDRSLRLALRPTPGAVRSARHRVVEWARDIGMAPEGEHVLALLTSEVVANAVRHAEGEIHLVSSATSRRITVEVSDGSTARPRLQRQPPTAIGGRGVDIVDRLATDWGVRMNGSGKVVWFVVPLIA